MGDSSFLTRVWAAHGQLMCRTEATRRLRRCYARVSLEYLGVDAFIDELYARSGGARSRARTQSPRCCRSRECVELGAKALHLEVEPGTDWRPRTLSPSGLRRQSARVDDETTEAACGVAATGGLRFSRKHQARHACALRIGIISCPRYVAIFVRSTGLVASGRISFQEEPANRPRPNLCTRSTTCRRLSVRRRARLLQGTDGCR